MRRRPRGRDEPTVRVAVLVARETEQQEEVPLIRVLVHSVRMPEATAAPLADPDEGAARRG